jgi:Uma2 family endonuclease
VRGLVVREPAPGSLHGRLLARLVRRLDEFVEGRGLGAVLADAGFVLATDPATIRQPDLAYVARDRVPTGGYGPAMWRLAPDLVIEILSPSNRVSDLQEKLFDYLDAGVRVIWLVDPRTRSVTEYRSRTDIRIIDGVTVLDGDDVLPGFRLALPELFGL